MDFHPVEFNLRESFRALAECRASAEVRELPGVSIASLGAKFQMFNAAFFSEKVETASELEERLRIAAGHFRARGIRWSLWVCEDWLAWPVRRLLSRRCEAASLRLATEMPGMTAERLKPLKRAIPEIECRPVDSASTLADFQGIGAVSFHVPVDWFTEVFDERMPAARPRFRCFVGYHDGQPVTTAACVRSGGVLGLYNIATAPLYRKKGFAEAITRHLARQCAGGDALVLQSTSHGFRLYESLGFRPVTRIIVYNSMP